MSKLPFFNFHNIVFLVISHHSTLRYPFHPSTIFTLAYLLPLSLVHPPQQKHHLNFLSSITKALLTHTLASFWRKQSCFFLTLKNNKAPLLSNIKLYVSFHHHMWIQIVTVRKQKVGSWPLWPWPLTLTFCIESGRIWRFFAPVTLKFYGRPWKTIGQLFYTHSSFMHHFIAIGGFRFELQSGNTQIGSNLTIFFASCDLEILRTTLKNNRAPLLYPFKLYASFHQLGAAANFDDCTYRQIWGPNVNNNIYILTHEYSSTGFE